ncbi:MAG: hypothetical protein WAZ77_04715 [Candidatus Nitrosopolaris sp.]
MYRAKTLTLAIFELSCLSTSIFKQQDQALAQQYIQTIKYRNLALDLGNGVKTNAQLTLPAIGKGPFPVCCKSNTFLLIAIIFKSMASLQKVFP